MIVGSELRQWLDDKHAQQRARESADAFATAWNDGPVSRLFASAMARLERRTAETVAIAAAAVLADDAAVGSLIEGLTALLRDNPFVEPPFRSLNSAIHSGLIIYEDDAVSVGIGVTGISRLAEKKRQKTGGSIHFSGQVELFRFVKGGGARLSFWEAPPVTAAFTAARSGRCRPAGRRSIADGDMLVVDGRCQSFTIDHACANLLIVQATVKPDQAPVSVEYGAVTHEYVGCSAADDNASRIQMITTLLRKLDCRAAFAAVAQFLDHPSFFVRWHIMRELLGLDAQAALPYLGRMAQSDPHPETRCAARAVLDRIEARTGARKAA